MPLHFRLNYCQMYLYQLLFIDVTLIISQFNFQRYSINSEISEEHALLDQRENLFMHGQEHLIRQVQILP